jgi:dipeptidyl-peptidase-4
MIFATFKKSRPLLIDTKDHKGLRLSMVTFDATEKTMLLACNSKQIFRHSFTADYYLYQIATKN